MSMVQEQWEFLKDVAALIHYADRLGIVLTGGELYRPQEMQDIYLRTGKTQVKISNHQKRLAIDFNFFVKGRLTYDEQLLRPLGEFWQSLNPKNRWGGNFDKDFSKKDNFVDSPHFERVVA